MCYDKELALFILKQVETAILQIQFRTAEIHTASDFLISPERIKN